MVRFDRDRDGTWADEISDGNGHSIDAVCYAVMDGRGEGDGSSRPYGASPPAAAEREPEENGHII